MLILVFLALLLAPCLLALLSSSVVNGDASGEVHEESGPMPRPRDFSPEPRQVMLQELELSEDFEIRSFPKGLSQRRLLLRDTESGVRLTIAQLREAAAELVKQGGEALVYELALVAAAMVATGKTVAEAAHATMEAARNVYAWFAWNGAAAGHRAGEAWAEAPPPIFELELDSGPQPKWREASQAA